VTYGSIIPMLRAVESGAEIDRRRVKKRTGTRVRLLCATG
jgi:hypothetical protein